MNRPRGAVSYDNSDRVVLVTGGSSGIGQVVCQRFAESGAHVVCVDVVEPTVDDSNEAIVFFQADVASEDACEKAVAWTIEQYGALDVLVNNAAIQPRESYVPLDQMPNELWQRMVNINFSGYSFMAKHALRQMKQQGQGVVVNVASGQGHRTAREVPAYGPIKAANIMQARQWGVEYARDGIRVVSVSPGAIATPLLQATLEEQGGDHVVANRHPLGRIGKPAEVAQAILWLSSCDASFITATDLEVDGGLGGFASFADPYPQPGKQDDS
jgi:NAD(P)-dependent dehydrogenase (short-subunit alcohol dehydrogenase family)